MIIDYVVEIIIQLAILIIGLLVIKITRKIIKSDKFEVKGSNSKFLIKFYNFLGNAVVLTGIVGIVDCGIQFFNYLF